MHLLGAASPAHSTMHLPPLPTYPALPLAARGTVGRSWAKPRSSGKCWLSDLARMCRKVDFPSTVLVEFSCKGCPAHKLFKVPHQTPGHMTPGFTVFPEFSACDTLSRFSPILLFEILELGWRSNLVYFYPLVSHIWANSSPTQGKNFVT